MEREFMMNGKTNLANEGKSKWEKPIVKTVSLHDLKEIITVSACSKYEHTEECPFGFRR